MKLFHFFNQFKEEMRQNHLEQMESRGLCPDCNGSRIFPTLRAIYTAPPDCSGCEGTGLFEVWANSQHE